MHRAHALALLVSTAAASSMMGMSVHGSPGMDTAHMSMGHIAMTQHGMGMSHSQGPETMMESMGMGMGMTGMVDDAVDHCDRSEAVSLVSGSLEFGVDPVEPATTFATHTSMSLMTCYDMTEGCAPGVLYTDIGDNGGDPSEGGISWSFDGTNTLFNFGDTQVSTSCGVECGQRGSVAVVVDCAPRPGPCACGRPASLTFLVTGGSCDDSSNFQAGKFECSDEANDADTNEGAVQITVAGSGLTATYPPTEDGTQLVTVTSNNDQFGAETMFDVFADGVLVQSLNVHTSCSKQLEFGDVFGSMTLVDSSCESDVVPDVLNTGSSTECDCHPSGMTFAYQGGECTVTHDQGGKLECEGAASGPATITCDSGDTISVSEGEEFTIGANGLGAQTDCTVSSEGGTQTLSIHTSCSQGLYLDDVYGSFRVVSWDCSNGNGMGMGMGMSVDVVGDMDKSMMMHSTGSHDGGCDCHPDALAFTYVGGACDQSNNEQGGKFECSGGAPQGTATIICDSGDTFTSVSIGDTLAMGGGSRLGAQTDCTVADDADGTTQLLSIHTSCSQGLYSGDLYGALEVMGWDCGDGIVTGDNGQRAGVPVPVGMGSCTVQWYRDGSLCDSATLQDVAFPQTSNLREGDAAWGPMVAHQSIGDGVAGAVRNMDAYAVALSASEVACLSEEQCAPTRCHSMTPTPTPGPGATASCDCHADEMLLMYVGGGCEASNNEQGGKFSCEGAVVGPVTITCDSGDVATGMQVGEMYRLGANVGNLGAQTDCTLDDGQSTQTLSIHTSCSQGLYAGDVYGALQVYGWDCGDGTVVAWEPPASPTPEPPAHVPNPDAEGALGECTNAEEEIEAPCANEITLATCVEAVAGVGETSLYSNGYGDDECVGWRMNADTGCFMLDLGHFNDDDRSTGDITTVSACLNEPIADGFVAVRARFEALPTCTCHPDTVGFVFTGEACADSPMNDQEGRFSCFDYGDITGDDVVVIVNGESHAASTGTTITAGSPGSRVGANTEFTIYAGGVVVQSMVVHTSCSKPISVGDRFGSVRVYSFSDCDADSNSMMGGHSHSGPSEGSSGGNGVVVVDFFVNGDQVGETQRVPVDTNGDTLLSTCPTEGATIGDSATQPSLQNFMMWTTFLGDADLQNVTASNMESCSCIDFPDCAATLAEPDQAFNFCVVISTRGMQRQFGLSEAAAYNRLARDCCADPEYPGSIGDNQGTPSIVDSNECRIWRNFAGCCCIAVAESCGSNNMDPASCQSETNPEGTPSCDSTGGLQPCCENSCFCEYAFTDSSSPVEYSCPDGQELTTAMVHFPFSLYHPTQDEINGAVDLCCVPVSVTPSPSPSVTSTPSPSPSSSATTSPSVSPTPTPSASPSMTPSVSTSVTVSPTTTPSPSPQVSVAQLEVNIPGLFYASGQVYMPCTMLTTMVPYFRICKHDYKETGNCGSETGYWRLPATELFIRSTEDAPGCLPAGEIAYNPLGAYILPSLNTLSQWLYPLSDPRVPVHENLFNQGQDAKTCMSYIDFLSTPDTDAARDTTIIPSGSDGLPESRGDFDPAVSCTYPINDPTNEQRQNYLQTMAQELDFEVVSEDGYITNQEDVLGRDPPDDTSDRNDIMFGEGGGGGSGSAPMICEGDEVISFGVSSTGLRTIQVGPDRITNVRHRVILHVRQTFDATDTCASELCFNTTKFKDKLGGVTAGNDGISCFDANERTQGSPKWALEDDQMEEYTLNGDHDFLHGTDLALVSTNQALLTGVCMQCDRDHPVMSALRDDPPSWASAGMFEEVSDCNAQSCRNCPAQSFRGDVTEWPAITQATQAAFTQLSQGAAAAGMSRPYAGQFSGLPINLDNGCPATIANEPYAPVAPPVEPIYQMFVASTLGLCVSADDDDNSCVNASPYDEYTTRIQLVFERAIPAHTDADGNAVQAELYAPPVSEMIDSTIDLEGIKIYSRRGTEVTCWIRAAGTEYDDDLPHDDNDLDFCNNMADWVPTFLVGDNGEDFGPAIVPGGQWPNNMPIRNVARDAWAMAVDCSALAASAYAEETLAQSKLVFFPVGPEDGPCWNDPDYGGEQVCAAGGVRGSHANDLYRDIDGNFYPFCADDNDGPCPRYFAFNCPAGSKKSTETQKLEF